MEDVYDNGNTNSSEPVPSSLGGSADAEFQESPSKRMKLDGEKPTAAVDRLALPRGVAPVKAE
jgi:hypothetical protein